MRSASVALLATCERGSRTPLYLRTLNLKRRTKNPSPKSSPRKRGEAVDRAGTRVHSSHGFSENGYVRFEDWNLGFAARGSATAKTVTRPSIPRTSCGGSSSKLNESA